MQCSNSPSSSYTTVNRYLVSEAGSEIEVYVPHGVVSCAFDNNQITGKTHIITGTNKVPTSVMTSTSYVQLNQSNLQEKEQLKPLHSMWEDESEELKKNFMELHINKVHVKGVLHPRPVFGLFLHFSQKLQHIGNK